MILPIVAYGHPVLRRETRIIDSDYPELETLITNMWETLYRAKGVGLAAPQIGLDIRLFPGGQQAARRRCRGRG